MPVSPEPNPRFVFERLFGAGEARRADARTCTSAREQQRSILDFVHRRHPRLGRDLGGHDPKLDEYLASVREIERRHARPPSSLRISPTRRWKPRPASRARSAEHVELMYDMMFLAFRTDSTRIATFLLPAEGSTGHFPDINIAEGHHNLSIIADKKETLDKIAEIDHWYIEHFARFLEKMDDVKKSTASRFFTMSMIVYGSGNGDGNRHNHDNLPVVLAARRRPLIPGRLLKFKSQPMNNIYLSCSTGWGSPSCPGWGFHRAARGDLIHGPADASSRERAYCLDGRRPRPTRRACEGPGRTPSLARWVGMRSPLLESSTQRFHARPEVRLPEHRKRSGGSQIRSSRLGR